jgi:HrpA-like RNA helicase
MDEELKANLALYVQSVDDDFVDTKLLLELLLKIHADEQEGAILVFLPGYEQIMSVREAILAEKRFSENPVGLKLFVLHSSIQVNARTLLIVIQLSNRIKILILCFMNL